jgi:excisionase family DNA binding protein
MTVADAAVFLAVSRRQVYLLVERNELPTVRVGSRLRFVPAELRAYLEGNREIAPEMREPDLGRAQDSRDHNCDGNATTAA